MNVLIADDHSIVRKGLIQIVKDISAKFIVDEAEDGKQVIEKAADKNYDIIILDISLPDKNGLDILKELKVINNEIRVLVLSTYPEELFAIRALKSGAAGYLNKSSAPEDLSKAIRLILEGRKYITETLAEKLAYSFEPGTSMLPHEKLSDREFEVLRLLAAGNTVTQIAEKLFLSSKTISTYRARILEKMCMADNSELTSYSIKNKLIE